MSYSTELSCPICRVKGGLHKMDCQNVGYVNQAVESAEEEALTAMANQRIMEQQLAAAMEERARIIEDIQVACGCTDGDDIRNHLSDYINTEDY